MSVSASTRLRDYRAPTCKFTLVLLSFSKDFLTKCGREGLWKMVEGFEDRSAYAQCIFAFSEGPGKEPKLFVGRCDGEIVAPRGENMFGWDPIF